MMYTHSYNVSVEWHSTPQLWVAYRCGCAECPKGFGKTKEEAIAHLKEQINEGRAEVGTAAGDGGTRHGA